MDVMDISQERIIIVKLDGGREAKPYNDYQKDLLTLYLCQLMRPQSSLQRSSTAFFLLMRAAGLLKLRPADAAIATIQVAYAGQNLGIINFITLPTAQLLGLDRRLHQPDPC